MITQPNITKQKLLSGVNMLADTVKCTLGTKGRLVVYTDYMHFDDPNGYPVATKDGVTVASNIRSEDAVENQAIKIVRQAAKNTVSTSGDGPQPLYAKVLTPSGFVEMGSLKVGDIICGTNGSFQTVLEVHPKGEKEICEVHFEDGSVVECCEDHLWTVMTPIGDLETLTLKEIIELQSKENTSNPIETHGRYSVPITSVEFYRNIIPIPPVRLGSLFKSIQRGEDIDITDKEIEKLEKEGIDVSNISGLFIPRVYLYNSKDVRMSLFLSIVNEMKINNVTTNQETVIEGLYNFSFYSKQLIDNICELAKSLGYVYSVKISTDQHNTNLYSVYVEVPRNNFNSIVSISPLSKTTQMQCIKVSNPDNLYITDDYIVTHNTTSTVLLSQQIIKKGYHLLEANISSWQINKEFDDALTDITKYIKDNSIDVYDDITRLKELATISSNNTEIGELIYDIIDELSVNCDIEVKKTKHKETSVEAVSGMKIHRGYFSPAFCNDYQTMTFEGRNAFIFIYDGVIRDYSDIAAYVRASADANDNPLPLFIYAKDVSKTALSRIENMLKFNPRPLMIVEHDGFGDNRISIMNDMAAITGAMIISEDDKVNRPKPSIALGTCEEVRVSDKFASIIGGHGKQSDIDEIVEDIDQRLKSNQYTKDERFLKKRKANLIGGIAVIHVGGTTSIEIQEKYHRIEDAVLAVGSAIRNGVSVGGAFTWQRASRFAVNDKRKYNRNDNPAYFAVFDALEEVLKQLLINSGEYTSEKFNEAKSHYLSDNPKAYNLIDRKYYPINNYKVYDATSVLEDSITNAISVAKLILAIEYSIHEPNTGSSI